MAFSNTWSLKPCVFLLKLSKNLWIQIFHASPLAATPAPAWPLLFIPQVWLSEKCEVLFCFLFGSQRFYIVYCFICLLCAVVIICVHLVIELCNLGSESMFLITCVYPYYEMCGKTWNVILVWSVHIQTRHVFCFNGTWNADISQKKMCLSS